MITGRNLDGLSESMSGKWETLRGGSVPTNRDTWSVVMSCAYSFNGARGGMKGRTAPGLNSKEEISMVRLIEGYGYKGMSRLLQLAVGPRRNSDGHIIKSPNP